MLVCIQWLTLVHIKQMVVEYITHTSDLVSTVPIGIAIKVGVCVVLEGVMV